VKRLITFFVLLFCLVKSFSQITKENVSERTKWLVGSWVGHQNGSPFYEAWRSENNGMVNYTIEIKKSDTTVVEQTAIRASKDKIVFGKKGEWLLKRLTRNEIVLESDSSKHGTRIIYLHLDNDHWFTILENTGFTMYFDMERLPALERVVDKFVKNKK